MKVRLGFTLVEVIVVIAIIGVLSTLIYANFDGARESARNKTNMTELKEMQLALEIYKAQNRRYPPVDTSAGSCHDDSGAIHTAENSNGTCRNYRFVAGLAPEFIGDLPRASDSKNPNCSYEYQVEATGSWYKLTAVECFEGATAAAEGIGEDEEFSRCPSSCASGPSTCGAGNNYNAAFVDSPAFYESMAIYSSGGECQ